MEGGTEMTKDELIEKASQFIKDNGYEGTILSGDPGDLSAEMLADFAMSVQQLKSFTFIEVWNIMMDFAVQYSKTPRQESDLANDASMFLSDWIVEHHDSPEKQAEVEKPQLPTDE